MLQVPATHAGQVNAQPFDVWVQDWESAWHLKHMHPALRGAVRELKESLMALGAVAVRMNEAAYSYYPTHSGPSGESVQSSTRPEVRVVRDPSLHAFLVTDLRRLLRNAARDCDTTYGRMQALLRNDAAPPEDTDTCAGTCRYASKGRARGADGRTYCACGRRLQT